MPWGAQTRFPGFDSSNRSNFGSHFSGQYHTPETCLGTLAELDFNGFDLREGLDLFLKHVWIKSTLWITTPKITRANLPDQVASMRMMGRDASFPRVMKRSSRGTAPVDCLHRSPAQATKAHGGYIDDGGNPESLRALAGLPEDLGTRNRIIRFAKGTKKREGTVFDEQVVGRQVQVVVSTKTKIIILLLGSRVHPTSLITVERSFLIVASHDVLAKLRSNGLEQVTHVAKDRKIPQNSVLPLQHIIAGKQPHHPHQ